MIHHQLTWGRAWWPNNFASIPLFHHAVAIITSCRWAAATICPRPSPPPWAPKRLAPPSRRQSSSSFPRPTHSHAHRCNRLSRQHGSEQSGLVTLNFWPWKWCPSHAWRGLPLCQFWHWHFWHAPPIRPQLMALYKCASIDWLIDWLLGLPSPLCSWLRPDVRDRQTDVRLTDDRRQTASSLMAPLVSYCSSEHTLAQGKSFCFFSNLSASCTAFLLFPPSKQSATSSAVKRWVGWGQVFFFTFSLVWK